MARLPCEAFVARAQVAIGNQRLDDRHQQLLFGPGAICLRDDEDVMCRIHGGDRDVPLDDALGRRRLHAVIVGAIALPHGARHAPSILRMGGEPLAELVRIARQPLAALLSP